MYCCCTGVEWEKASAKMLQERSEAISTHNSRRNCLRPVGTAQPANSSCPWDLNCSDVPFTYIEVNKQPRGQWLLFYFLFKPTNSPLTTTGKGD